MRIMNGICAALVVLSGCVQLDKEMEDNQSSVTDPADVGEQQYIAPRGFDVGPTAGTEVGKLPDKPREEDISQTPDTIDVDSGSDAESGQTDRVPECEWSQDCYTGYLAPWTTNECVQGSCIQAPPAIEYDYKAQDVDATTACVSIQRLGSDGWWHTDSYPMPHVVSLEELCPSLEKAANVSPDIAPEVLNLTKRLSFAFTPCGGAKTNLNLSDELSFDGTSIQFLPAYTSLQITLAVVKDPLSSAKWGYIKGLGAYCHLYNHPNPAATLYLWD